MEPFTSSASEPGRPRTFRHESLTCPWCAAQMDATTNFFSGRPPGDGAPMICVSCTNMGVFVVSALGAVSLRKPNRQEAATFAATHGGTLRTLREYIKENPPPSVKRDVDKGGYQ